VLQRRPFYHPDRLSSLRYQLQNGDAFIPSMLDAIRTARTRVDYETYIYETGTVADRFTAALEAAAKRGVTVNLVVDAFGSKKMSGLRVSSFPPPTVVPDDASPRHRKASETCVHLRLIVVAVHRHEFRIGDRVSIRRSPGRFLEGSSPYRHRPRTLRQSGR
jgi:phosphatidylserine/phosphatidylglycerophosphate/cardiolipin synthase-like enzyme